MLFFQNRNFRLTIIDFLPRKWRSIFHYYVRDPGETVREIRKDGKKWRVSLVNLVTTLLMQFCTTVFCYAILLYFINYLWFTFTNIHAGNIYISTELSPQIVTLMKCFDQPLLGLALSHSAVVLLVSLSLGLATHFLAIKRYFYDAHGLIVRLIWILFVSGASAYFSGNYSNLEEFHAQVVLSFFPACCLIHTSFILAALLIPEISIVFKISKIRRWIEIARIRNMD